VKYNLKRNVNIAKKFQKNSSRNSGTRSFLNTKMNIYFYYFLLCSQSYYYLCLIIISFSNVAAEITL